ncbi:hypothetical protein OY671_009079, partial [Metschnikowia pulcherrima]
AKSYGDRGDAIVQAARERTPARGQTRGQIQGQNGKGADAPGSAARGIERGVSAVSAAIRDATEKLAVHSQRPEDPLVDKGLARLTMSPATARTQYATASAIRILGEREVAFPLRDVVKKALDLGQKGVTHDKVEKRIDQSVRGCELVSGKSTRHDQTRMDLAYAINTHMAQGITSSVVYAVMGSFERNLSNARSFSVNLTRQQD